MSDQTHLTDFSGNRKPWPVYIILGNLISCWCNSPTSMAVLLLALLPILLKLSKSSKADQRQRHINADTLWDIFELIFGALQDPAHDGLLHSADQKVRRCFPIVAMWMTDHIENIVLNGIKSNV